MKKQNKTMKTKILRTVANFGFKKQNKTNKKKKKYTRKSEK